MVSLIKVNEGVADFALDILSYTTIEASMSVVVEAVDISSVGRLSWLQVHQLLPKSFYLQIWSLSVKMLKCWLYIYASELKDIVIAERKVFPPSIPQHSPQRATSSQAAITSR